MTEEQMRAGMKAGVRRLLGPGYVDRYYEDMAEEFVRVALAYAGETPRQALNALRYEL